MSEFCMELALHGEKDAKTVENLLKNGADADHMNDEGLLNFNLFSQCLFIANSQHETNVVTLNVLKVFKNNAGQTPLHVACKDFKFRQCLAIVNSICRLNNCHNSLKIKISK